MADDPKKIDEPANPPADPATPPADPATPPADPASPPADPKAKKEPLIPAGNDPDPDDDDDGAEDWRVKAAGNDAKVLKALGRYNSVGDVAKALVEAKTKLRAGPAAPAALADDASDEEVAEWREANGVPADVDGYEIDLDEIENEDVRGTYSDFLEKAHAANMPKAVVEQAIGIYREAEDAALDRIVERNLEAEDAVRTELTDEWGGRVEYKRNIAMAENYLGALPDGIGRVLMTATAPDGTKLGNNLGVVKWIASMARESGYADDFIPGGPSEGGKGVEERLAEIKKAMKEGSKGSYWTNPAMQKEYGELLAAKARHDARKA